MSTDATVATPLVGVIMGSQSDWETMSHTAEILDSLGIAHECRVVSAHRTPDLLFDYAGSAGRGRPATTRRSGDRTPSRPRRSPAPP